MFAGSVVRRLPCPQWSAPHSFSAPAAAGAGALPDAPIPGADRSATQDDTDTEEHTQYTEDSDRTELDLGDDFENS